MPNLYTIIIGLFTAAGILMSIWGGINIRKAKKNKNWPSVEGIIVAPDGTPANLNPPQVNYNYALADQNHTGFFKLTEVDTAMPGEKPSKPPNKYPVNSPVKVFYDPENPQVSTLEPGIRGDDWFLFCLGIGAIVLGSGILIFYG